MRNGSQSIHLIKVGYCDRKRWISTYSSEYGSVDRIYDNTMMDKLRFFVKFKGSSMIFCSHAVCTAHLSKDYYCASGTPWTEEEHRMFLMGLQKLGKGDWRGISRNFVVSRTPTQVASHAQKYFIRQTNSSRRKRRSSLFDMVPEMVCCVSFL